MRDIVITLVAVLAGISALLAEVTGIIAAINYGKSKNAKDGAARTLFSMALPRVLKDSFKEETPKICRDCGAEFDADKFICPNCRSTEYTLAPVSYDYKYIVKGNKWKRIFNVSLIAFVVLLGAVFVLSATLPEDQNSNTSVEDLAYDIPHFAYVVDGVENYNDMKGNAYTNPNDVLYYDELGNAYKYSKFSDVFICNGKTYDSILSFVDKNGYFVYQDYDSDIFWDEDISRWVDSDNNIYMAHYYASWNTDGDLINSFNGNPLFD